MEDATKLFQLLSVNPCTWKTQKEGEPWPYDCRAVLQCTVPDALNAQYSLCPEVAGLPESQWSQESAKTLLETDTTNCKMQDTHLKRCRYSPEQVDGTPYGDDPTMSDSYCRIRTKPHTSAPR